MVEPHRCEHRVVPRDRHSAAAHGAPASNITAPPRQPAGRAPTAAQHSLNRRGVLGLQSVAGNAAVTRLLTRVDMPQIAGPVIQREVLAFHNTHIDVLPSAGLTLSQSTVTYSGEAARVKAALQPLIDAGKVLATDDGKHVFFANTGATRTELVAAFTTGGLPKADELASATLSEHNVFIFSGSRVSKLETLFGSSTVGSQTDVVERQTSRLATHFERTEAAKVFRGSLNLDHFVIVEDPVMSVGGFARTTPTAVNMPPGTLNRTDIMPWLVHEFTHAWQYQHGVSIATTLVEAIRARYDYGGRDQLINDRKLGKRFTDYTTEQQADICSDFYELLIAGGDVTAHQPYVDEVRNPALPGPANRSPVLDLNDQLLLDAKLPLRKVEGQLAANSCSADAAASLQRDTQGIRTTVDKIQQRIDKFPGTNPADVERKIIKADIDGATSLAESLESRMKASCNGGRTACLPLDPNVVVATLGGPAVAGVTTAPPPAAVQTALQRAGAGAGDLEGLRPGDGLRPGSTDLQPRVRQLQEALNEAGATLGSDGKFGNGTKAAVIDFQAQRGLPVRPFVDEVTADLLADPSPTQVLVSPSTFQGLRRGDGLNVGTFELRPRVTALQERLTTVGSHCTPDGMFGPLTLAALNEFQVSRRLQPSEEVDVLTADALDGRSPDPDQPSICDPGEIPVVASA